MMFCGLQKWAIDLKDEKWQRGGVGGWGGGEMTRNEEPAYKGIDATSSFTVASNDMHFRIGGPQSIHFWWL